MTYPIALRVRAIRMYLEFVKSFRRLGTLLDVGKSTIQRWVTPPWIQKSMSRKTVLKITDRARKLIHDTVQQSPFATANQLVQTLREQLDLNVSEGSVRLWRRKLGFSRKKAFQQVVHKDGLEAKRLLHCQRMQTIAMNQVISIDESAFYLDMKPSYGFSKKGQRLGVSKHPKFHSRWTLLMAVSSQQVVHWELFVGSCNTKRFCEFIEHMPALEGCNHLMMDNASIHTGKSVQDCLKSKCLIPIYLSPYSPIFQPIELCFSTVKHYFRKTIPGSVMDTLSCEHDMQARVADCVNKLHAAILQNQFQHCWNATTKFMQCREFFFVTSGF